jgi:ParB family chromosome partitioning protein
VVGRSRSSVSNLIRLLQLGDNAKQLLSNGDIEMGHAAILAARQRRSPAMISYLS